MAQTDFQTVNQYIASRPIDEHTALESIRNAIKNALPYSEEVIGIGVVLAYLAIQILRLLAASR